MSSSENAGVSHAWEETDNQKAWDRAIQEDADGNIVVASGDTVNAAIRKRRKRMALNDYAKRDKRVARDMIRYLYVLLDASRWMRQKDPMMPPGTRIQATTQLLEEFVTEFFDQNPLSYLGFVVCMKGEAEMLTPLSSSSKVHKVALQSLSQLAMSEGGPNAGGEFSLQNGIELVGRSLGHQPRHGSREIVILTAALSSCDPGYILTDTIPKIERANIRVSCFALSAELHICRRLTELTGGAMGVCLDKAHFREWLTNQTVPPPSTDADKQRVCEMVKMGFPTRTSTELPQLVHATREKAVLSCTSYTCPQCQAHNLELPADCAICGLKLVLSPHLARSFHHLFPVPPFEEAPIQDSMVSGAHSVTSNPAVSASVVQPLPSDHNMISSSQDDDHFCFACIRPFNEINCDPSRSLAKPDPTDLLRFRCPRCLNLFCVDCDAFLHEQLHNCPGCLLSP